MIMNLSLRLNYILLLQQNGTYRNVIIELRHEISKNVVYVTNNGSDQPAHMRSLIRAFASRLNILWALSY